MSIVIKILLLYIFTHLVLSVIASIVCIDETYAHSVLAIYGYDKSYKVKLSSSFILESGTDTELFKVSVPLLEAKFLLELLSLRFYISL